VKHGNVRTQARHQRLIRRLSIYLHSSSSHLTMCHLWLDQRELPVATHPTKSCKRWRTMPHQHSNWLLQVFDMANRYCQGLSRRRTVVRMLWGEGELLRQQDASGSQADVLLGHPVDVLLSHSVEVVRELPCLIIQCTVPHLVIEMAQVLCVTADTEPRHRLTRFIRTLLAHVYHFG
jgi:hypothetical protein